MSSGRKIYTKAGDTGETSLLGGTRVSKSHERVEAYGTLDELNAFIGALRDLPIGDHYRKILIHIQENIFIAEALVASDPDKKTDYKLPVIGPSEIEGLELEIDRMNSTLPDLQNFILPGGHPAVSACHVARTVCRRAERTVIRVSLINPVDEAIIKYLNRLSDYLFVLARKIGQDLGVTETPWIAKH